ncbi:MAG: alpha/beta hydrolase-fold protein [Actinobacteria bacterium]|nr:alpha/beta hydrolase-fold protein [Actinomycetota bacterium]
MKQKIFPLIGVAALALFTSVFSNHSYSRAAPLPTPLAPKITSVESVKKTSKTYDLRISVSVNKGSSKLPIIATRITATNKSCNIASGKQSCTITGMPMRTQVTIRAISRNKNGTGISSSPVRYTVGSARWSIAPSTTQPTSTSTTTVSSVRAYSKFVPSSYSKDTSIPLVVLLHGYGATGAQQESYMKFESVAEKNKFILVYPDGTTDSVGKRFWNATDACCNFFSEVDDDAYLLSILKEVESNYSIDAKRIYFVGHSNGGFMSYRMACRHPDRIAAIASLAGASFFKETDCGAKSSVSVLQVHGTKDETILYEGGQILGNSYPSAFASASQWATVNQCTKNAVSRSTKLDLEGNIAGDETSIKAWTNCQNSSEVELWTVENATHIPTLSSTFATKIWEFFAAHPKP